MLGKKLLFISSVMFDYHMTYSLSIAAHAFASHVLMSFSLDETLFLRLVNLSPSFKGLPFHVKMSLFLLQHMYSFTEILGIRKFYISFV